MNKRILRSMSLIILFTVVVFVAFAFILVSQFDDEIKSGLKTLRVTIVDLKGDVIFDNQANPEDMDNHLARPEISEAIENGFGESERYSDTLDEITYYYAFKMKDGNVIRLAMTTSSTHALLYRFVPIAIICVLVAVVISFFIARRFANRIIKPINDIDFENPKIDLYEELLPFIKKIAIQKEEIERQLSELENRSDTIKSITENMQEGLLLVNEEGIVILANRSILDILGEDDVIGKDIVAVCREPRFVESIKSCFSGEKEEIIINRNENVYQVLFDPVKKGEVEGGAAVLFINVTEKHTAEQQRKEFSANVSHELKTPLTTIVAISEMLSQGSVKEADIPHFGKKIHSQSERLLAIIDDIMRLSEFDESRINKDFELFNLYDLADNVLLVFDEKASEKNIKLTLYSEKDVSSYAIKRMIEELLYNLIDNAIKYNKENGNVEVYLEEKEKFIVISVKDSGIGIPKEKTGRIFERFYRVDSSRSKKTGGTGLGLSIVKHIVELHNGQIEVESEEQIGTKIICTIQNSLY